MADGLDPVVQEFIADVTKYVEGLAEATSAANDFRDANLEAAAAVKVLQDQMDNTDGSTTDFADALNGIHDALQVTDDDIQNRYLSNLEDLRSANTDAADTTHDLDAAMRDLEARFGELAFMSDADVGSLHTLEASFSDLGDAIRRGGDDLAEVRDRILEAGAAAGIDEAPLAALAEAFDRVAEAAGDARTATAEEATAEGASALSGVLQRLGGIASGLAGTILPGLAQAGGQLPGVFGSIGAAGGGVGAIGLLALAGAAAMAVTAVFPLLSVIPLIAVGIGGFAYAAMPQLSAVFTAITATGKAAHTAMAGLTPAERDLVRQTEPLKDEFAKLQKAIQPAVITAFAEGIKIVKDLMPVFISLVKAAGKALDGLLTHIADWLNSGSGQKFIHWMERDGPHAIEAFGRALWTMIQIAGHVFDFLYNTGERFNQNWRTLWDAAARVVDRFVTGFTQMGHLIESIWDAVVSWVESHGQQWISWFQSLPGRILATLTGLPAQMFSLGLNIINGLLHGIESAAGSVLSYIGHLASDISGVFSHILGMLSPSRVFHQHGVMLMTGLANGITAGLPLAQAAMAAAAARLAAPSLPGGYRPALAGAGAAGGAAGAGGFTWTGNVIVNGSVITQQELRGYVQQAVLDAWTRNRGLGFTPYGYPGH